jgi:translation initiation factor 2 alpha subunit (eIF-2alpha)
MWTVPKSEIADLLRPDLSARLREAQEKTKLFERAYGQTYNEFERAVLQGEEDFEKWDDYVEWKAYRKLKHDLEEKINALQRGDFEVA